MLVHPTLRRIVAAVGASIAVAAVAGCADSSEPTGGLAIVLGGRSNMPAPVLAGHAQDALEKAITSQSRMSVVVADGAPFEVQGGRLASSAINAEAQKRDRQKWREVIRHAVEDARGKTPETDLLTALDVAERKLDSASGEHTIVVLDSGLSTAGVLNFAAEPALLDQDPQVLAGNLETQGQLPDLGNVTVVFQGLGDTFAPQPALGRPERTNLIAIWTAIVRAAGGREVVEQAPLDQPPAGPLPWVTPVSTDAGATCTVTLTSEAVAFRPDSAAFLDRAAAEAVLRPIAATLTERGATAVLTGTTARVGDKEGQVQLSLERAQAVRELLVDLGAPEASMTAVGLGSDFPTYVDDHTPAGDLIPEAAEANRKVLVELAGAGALDCGTD